MTGKVCPKRLLQAVETSPQTFNPATGTPPSTGGLSTTTADQDGLVDEVQPVGNLQSDVVIGPDGAGRPTLSSLILGDSSMRRQLAAVLAEMLCALRTFPGCEPGEEGATRVGEPEPSVAALEEFSSRQR